jgi:carboxymethylenebutenolidase
MEDKIKSLYEDYRSGYTGRRDFLKRLALMTGSTAVAMTLLPLLEDSQLTAAEKRKKISEVLAEAVTYQGDQCEMKAYLAHPSKGKKFPAVIVIQEIFGLNDHIREVTRRMAGEGFLALAPDALSPLGGTPEDTTGAREMMGKLDAAQTVNNYVAAVKYLKTHPLSNGKVGCTGFCWGGAMTNQVAVNCPSLDAAVPYYGSQPKTEEVPTIKAPLLIHYAENDQRINAGIEAFEKALKENNKEFQSFIYPGTGHGFNNDSAPQRYHEQAAKLAWSRTVTFFREKLK